MAHCQGHREGCAREGKEGHREENSRLPGAVGVSKCRSKQQLKSQQPVTVLQTQHGSAIWCLYETCQCMAGQEGPGKAAENNSAPVWRRLERRCWHLAGVPQVCGAAAWSGPSSGRGDCSRGRPGPVLPTCDTRGSVPQFQVAGAGTEQDTGWDSHPRMTSPVPCCHKLHISMRCSCSICRVTAL